MKKNDLDRFKDLDNTEKFGFVSVFFLLFSLIFIFLFTNFDKVFAITEKDTPEQVLETGLFLTADVEQEQDINLYGGAGGIFNEYLLLCVNTLTIDYYRYTSDNVYKVPSSIPPNLINSPYYNADLSFGPFVCYNYFQTLGFQRDTLITNDFRDLRTTLFDNEVYFNFYATSPALDNFVLGYNHNALLNTYYSIYNQTTDENATYYDLGYNAGVDVGYDNGFLEGSSDPKAVSDYLRDSQLGIDLEVEVNGVKNEIIDNFYYQYIVNERIYVKDFTLVYAPPQSASHYALDLGVNVTDIVFNNYLDVKEKYDNLFPEVAYLNFTGLDSRPVYGSTTTTTIYYLNNVDYFDTLYFHTMASNPYGFCNVNDTYGCHNYYETTRLFKQFMTDNDIEYLDFTYVLNTPIITDLYDVDFDFFNYDKGYDKGYDNGEQVGFMNGFNDGQQSGIDTMSGSWISNLFVGLGALFSIAIAPNITIGMIAMIPIVLALVPFVIGLATGKRGRD